MGDLLHETTPPLAWNHEGDPFQAPDGMVGWKVRKHSGKPGRPPVVWSGHGVLHLGLDADVDELRRAVKDEPGSYRLYPVNKFGHELEPVGVIELIPDDGDDSDDSTALTVAGSDAIELQREMGPPPLSTEVSFRFFDLYERMLTSRDAHDELMTRMLTTLVGSMAGIQQSTAGLLDSASTTIKVANGVESLERAPAPDLDIEGLTEKLAVVGQLKETLAALGAGGKSETPWFVHLLNGPMGMGLMSFANNFAKAAAQAQAEADNAKATNEGDD